MLRVLTLLLCFACVGVVPGEAEIYRWTDSSGRVHFTDNPALIPPDRRLHSRQLSPLPSSSSSASPGAAVSTPSQPPAASAGSARAAKAANLRQREQTLKQQLDTATQERQRVIEQLNATRPAQTNPAFGRQRRQVDELGRSLAALERQRDTLQGELQEVQEELQSLERAAPFPPSEPPATSAVTADAQGHHRAYWQQRLAHVHTRLQQAEAQRQAILEKLAGEGEDERRTFGRRGDEVLRLTKELQQVEQDLRSAEAELQAVLQAARQAGAPDAWLQD